MISIKDIELENFSKRKFKKGSVIFSEGSKSINYYQIISGEVKMCNFNDDGREFIQGFFYQGHSFGEPPLLLNRPYPANAIAVLDTEVYVLKSELFLNLIKNNNTVSMSIINHLAERLHYKSVMAAEISSQEPEHRLLKLIDYSILFFKIEKGNYGYKINFTRQQMADLTGLRVETVIRAIKSLEKKKELKIIERKVFR
jgi:CRP-like cAMP-binding protein